MMARTLLLTDLTNIVMRCSLGGMVPADAAADTACNMIARTAGQLGATHLLCAIDSSAPTWRRQRLPDYKHGRTLKTQAFSDAAAETARRRGWVVLEAPGFEGDDVVATVTERATPLFDVAIFSGDSDAEVLVRRGTDLHGAVFVVWPLTGGTFELHDVDAVCARWRIAAPAQLTDYKAIAGEKGDNVEGVGGRTPAGKVSEQHGKARRLIAAYGSLAAAIAAGERNDSREAREAYLVRDRLELGRELLALRTDVPLPELRLRACALGRVEAAA